MKNKASAFAFQSFVSIEHHFLCVPSKWHGSPGYIS